jgi:hypothetical protein
MALSFTLPANAPSPTAVVRSAALGGLKLRFAKITTDGTYTNGTGYAVTPANFKLDTAIVFLIGAEGLSGNKPVWDSVNQKLKFMVGAAGVDVEAATNLASLNGATFDVMVIGY